MFTWKCVVEGKFVFWFGAQFNSTHNFTQSRWLILFSPHLFPGHQKLGKLPNTPSLAEQCHPVQMSHWPFFNSSSSSSSMDTRGNLSNLWCPGKRSGLNWIGHPDWVKLCGELNCAPNQNTNFPSTTNVTNFWLK